MRQVEEMICHVISWSTRRTLRGKVFRGRESSRAFVQGPSAGQEDDAIEHVIDLRTRLMDRRDHGSWVVRVVREGVQDRDDFGSGDRIEAYKKSRSRKSGYVIFIH